MRLRSPVKMPSLQRPRGALRLPPARRLVGAELASLTGDFIVLPAIPVAVIALGGSGGDLARAFAAQGAGVVLMLPFGGVLGDRFQRRAVMIAADLVRLAAGAAIAAAFLFGFAAYWQLLLAQALHGLATGAFMPAAASIVPDVVPKDSVQSTNAKKAMARSIAGVGGPALGGLLLLLGGAGLAMAADAASFLASAALLWGLPAGLRERVGAGVVEELREGWLQFRSRRWLRSMTLAFALLNAAVLAPFYVCAPTIAERSLGAGAWALALCLLAAGGVIGGRLASAWRPQRPLVAATAVFSFWALPLLLLGSGAPAVALGAAMVLAGCGESAFVVLWETTVQRRVEEAQLARLCSFEQLGSLALVPFGFVLGGWLEQAIGARSALLGAGVLLLAACAGLLALPCIRGLLSSRESEPDGAVAVAQLRPRPAPGLAFTGEAA